MRRPGPRPAQAGGGQWSKSKKRASGPSVLLDLDLARVDVAHVAGQTGCRPRDVHAPALLELSQGIRRIPLADARAPHLAGEESLALLVDGDDRAGLRADRALDLHLLAGPAIGLARILDILAVVTLEDDLLGE